MLLGMAGAGAYFTSAYPVAADYVRRKLNDDEMSEDECGEYITDVFLDIQDERDIFDGFSSSTVSISSSDIKMLKSSSSGLYRARVP